MNEKWLQEWLGRVLRLRNKGTILEIPMYRRVFSRFYDASTTKSGQGSGETEAHRARRRLVSPHRLPRARLLDVRSLVTPPSISTYDQWFIGTMTPRFRFQSVSTNGIPRGRLVSFCVHFSSFARQTRIGPNQPDFAVSLMS